MVSARATAALSQTPDALHRRKRRKIEFQLPYFSGMSRHGAPVRSRHRMPLMTLRLSSGGRPRPRFPTSRSIGNKTRKIRHSTSVRSPRLKAASLESAALNQNEIHASMILSTSPRTPSNVCRERNTDWVAGDNSCVCHHNKQDHDHKVRDRIRKDRKAPDCKHRAHSHSRYWRRSSL